MQCSSMQRASGSTKYESVGQFGILFQVTLVILLIMFEQMRYKLRNTHTHSASLSVANTFNHSTGRTRLNWFAVEFRCREYEHFYSGSLLGFSFHFSLYLIFIVVSPCWMRLDIIMPSPHTSMLRALSRDHGFDFFLLLRLCETIYNKFTSQVPEVARAD